MLLNATESGLQSLQAMWTSTPPKIRKALGDNFKDQLKASAQAYDELRKGMGTPDAIAALNGGSADDIPTTTTTNEVF